MWQFAYKWFYEWFAQKFCLCLKNKAQYLLLNFSNRTNLHNSRTMHNWDTAGNKWVILAILWGKYIFEVYCRFWSLFPSLTTLLWTLLISLYLYCFNFRNALNSWQCISYNHFLLKRLFHCLVTAKAVSRSCFLPWVTLLKHLIF